MPNAGFLGMTVPTMQVTRLTRFPREKSISPIDIANICPTVTRLMGMAMFRSSWSPV